MNRHDPQPIDLYGGDFYAWTQHQAELLRSVDGAVPGVPRDLDIQQIAEEIEDLGKSDLRAAQSFVRQILIHVLKAASEPDSLALAHWRAEATEFSVQLKAYYARSMRQLLDINQIWDDARKIARLRLLEQDGRLAPDLPARCPFTLDEIVSDAFDFDDAVKRLASRQ